jgi:hypothetical protein
MDFCSNCGESIEVNSKHCGNCGVKVNDTDVVQSDLKEIQNNSKKKKNKIIIVLILALIGCNFLIRPKTCDVMGDKSLIEVAKIIKNGDYPSSIYTYSIDALIYFIGNSKKGKKFNKEYILGYVFSDCLGLIKFSSKKEKSNIKKQEKKFERPGGDEFKLSEKPTINELFSSCVTKFQESFIKKGYKLSEVYSPDKNATQYFGDFYNGKERVLKNSHYTRYYYFELQKEINEIYSVVAPKGLNYRKSFGLKSQVSGKFSFKEKVRLLEKTNKTLEVDDYDSLGNFNKKIKGNWIKVISVLPNKEGFYNSGYVFDGYLKKSKDYTSETKTYSVIVDLTDCSVSRIKESNPFSH